MTPTDLGTLAVLALIDSTSTGTLVVPLVMLLQPQVRWSRIGVYLAVIAGFYWVLGLGLAILGTGLAGLPGMRDALESTPTYVAQVAVGLALFGGSYLVDDKAIARRRARRSTDPRPGLVKRLTASVLGPDARWSAVIALALGAGLIEAASMLPYLGAIGLISRAQLPWATVGLVLAAYTVVMIMPALVLLGLRGAAGTAADAALARINAWVRRHSANTLAWAMGILGVLLVLNAVGVLVRRGFF